MELEGMESETMAEEDGLDMIGYKCDLLDGNLLERYTRSVQHIVRQIKRAEERVYWFEPILIATDIVEGVEISLPKSMFGYRIKVLIVKNNLFIVELASGDPYGAGVVNLISQMTTWNFNKVWAVCLNSQNNVSGPSSSSSPDVVVAIPSNYAAAGQNLGRVVIIELEVSNRNPRQMRGDFQRHFDEDTVHSVLVIKCFGDTANPAKHACAVLWSRAPGEEIRVTDVWDFGFLPLQPVHQKNFAAAVPQGLPAVQPQQWQLNRFLPIQPDLVTPAGEPPLTDLACTDAALAYVQSLWPPQSRHVMYTQARPFVVFSGNMLMSYLHNLPPEAPPVEDFSLDLGELFYSIVCHYRG